RGSTFPALGRVDKTGDRHSSKLPTSTRRGFRERFAAINYGREVGLRAIAPAGPAWIFTGGYTASFVAASRTRIDSAPSAIFLRVMCLSPGEYRRRFGRPGERRRARGQVLQHGTVLGAGCRST
ncbi:MAG TPA: hypothetical protein VH165_07595, partial [Kofleriaceae bacterium]|nr:hypothetical protein [Kofleriaceae bacterium]